MDKKIIGLDIDQNSEKSFNFFSTIQDLLNVEVLKIDRDIIMLSNNIDYTFGKFTRASFDLELFLLSDEKYWTNNKEYTSVILGWGDYSTEKIVEVKPFLEIYNKNLIVFSNLNREYKPEWIFGNAIAITKWASSLFKIDFCSLSQRDLDF